MSYIGEQQLQPPQSGTGTFGSIVSPNATAVLTVTFPAEFTHAPLVFLQLIGDVPGLVSLFVSDTDEFGFTINCFNGSGADYTPTVAWMAVP